MFFFFKIQKHDFLRFFEWLTTLTLSRGKNASH